MRVIIKMCVLNERRSVSVGRDWIHAPSFMWRHSLMVSRYRAKKRMPPPVFSLDCLFTCACSWNGASSIRTTLCKREWCERARISSQQVSVETSGHSKERKSRNCKEAAVFEWLLPWKIKRLSNKLSSSFIGFRISRAYLPAPKWVLAKIEE